MKVRTGIEVSVQSDIGCLRQNNEDSFGYWEPEDDQQFLHKGRLAVVADGMGGYEGGPAASRRGGETQAAGVTACARERAGWQSLAPARATTRRQHWAMLCGRPTTTSGSTALRTLS